LAERQFFNKRHQEFSRGIEGGGVGAFLVGLLLAGMLAFLVVGSWVAGVIGAFFVVSVFSFAATALSAAKRMGNATARRAYLLALLQMFCGGGFLLLFMLGAAHDETRVWLMAVSSLALALMLWLANRNRNKVFREWVAKDDRGDVPPAP
jgi:hypothetical protein